MSTFEDCRKFLSFVVECFVQKPATVDHVKLQELRTAEAEPEGSDECRSTQILNGRTQIRVERKLTEEPQTGFGPRDSNSSREAYALTNIYIYPIKSCAAFEVRAHGTSLLFFACLVFFISFAPPDLFLVLCCSSCRSRTGRWDRWVCCMTEAGWWLMETACAWVRSERHVYASFAHKSTSRQTNCSFRRQVSDSVDGSLKINAMFNKRSLNQSDFLL